MFCVFTQKLLTSALIPIPVLKQFFWLVLRLASMFVISKIYLTHINEIYLMEAIKQRFIKTVHFIDNTMRIETSAMKKKVDYALKIQYSARMATQIIFKTKN